MKFSVALAVVAATVASALPADNLKPKSTDMGKCLTDHDCPSGQHCSIGGDCYGGFQPEAVKENKLEAKSTDMGKCLTDHDCPSGQHCSIGGDCY